MKEYTFEIYGAFKVLADSDEEANEKFNIVKNSLGNILSDMELKGIINSYGRKWTGSGGWFPNIGDIKRQDVNI